MSSLLLEARNISKSFGAVRALENVSLSLERGEILGLVGDNAAGKSTFLKILAGVHLPDHGELLVEGKKIILRNPRDARHMGIEMVYQDFMLAPNLDIVANIFLGREVTKWKVFQKLEKRKMRERAMQVLEELGIQFKSLNSLVMNLSGGQQQMVAIARALLYDPKVILMDEPTASLSVRAIEPLLQLVENLKERGCSVIYVSHRLPDVLAIANRIVVLRSGRIVAERKREETNLEEIVYFMMGLDKKEGDT
ncbi:MAG: ATP-binding cassette domain-containing protein [Atribacterota bacterium]|nr:ATP-binding cassette domain-containing protein [Atribacterota bacterium]